MPEAVKTYADPPPPPPAPTFITATVSPADLNVGDLVLAHAGSTGARDFVGLAAPDASGAPTDSSGLSPGLRFGVVSGFCGVSV